MASYTVYLDCSKSWEGYIDVTTTDDAANNRTYVECELYAYKTDGYSSGSNGACFNPSITIDGTTTWGTSYTTEYTSARWHASASKWVSHNSSGAKTITVSGQITKVSGSPATQLDGTTLSGSKSITLTTYNVIQTYSVTYYPGTYGSPNTTYSATKTQDINLTLRGLTYTRSGYTQTGWASNAAGTTYAYNLSQSYTYNQNLTLYPYWSATTYTISYYPGTYGTGSATSQSKSHGSSVTLLGRTYTRSGYTQTGWASNAAGTNYVYNLSQIYSDESGLTLYPYWEPNVYTLTINPNGGSMYNGGSKTVNTFTTEFAYNTKTYMGNLMNDGSYYPNNEPTREGYQFNGFTFTGGSGQKNTSGDPFYFQGSYSANAEGYGTTTNTWIFNGNYAGAVTATAQWTGNTYYVQYNGNGATSGSMSNSTHTYGSAKALTANAYSKTNYSFTGWNTKADGTGDTYTNQQSVTSLTSIAGSTVQLYAQWGQATYTIIFNMNNGSATSGNFGPMTCTCGTSYTLPTGTMVRSGYDFKGWSKTSTATTATYTNGQSITDIGNAGQTITLYAIWKAKSIKIKYHANNGTSYNSTNTYNATVSNTFATTTWAYDGYEHIGWARSSTATTPDYYLGQSFSGDLGVADGNTLNLYAVWVAKQPWTLSIMNIRRSNVFKEF